MLALSACCCQDIVPLGVVVFLSLVFGELQHDLVANGRKRFAAMRGVVAHGRQLAAPGTEAVCILGLCVHELLARGHGERF